MKKLTGFLLIAAGSILIIFSILILIRAFDTYTSMGSSTESMGYTIGSVIFPLLLTVIGRWIYRKGRGFLKNNPVKN
ncbi:hypothetical protein CNR22_07830 [Sphingobacteriaceae bacterium]|nr:hypothetical protein CNR22_07830 [Sphingobacteriaceae bacterium]